MTIYELRDMLKGKDITDLPLRCATYSRVSTEKEAQAASLENMTDDFREYIDRQENWVFVKAYIDDGKSGLTTQKRKDFLNLLAGGAAGEYDLLVTGEISRFGRNLLEGLQNIQYLLNKGIPVIFLYDELNTYDPDCEVQIQQKLVDAENESRKISKRVKRGFAKSIQKGHVLGNRTWGYKKENCKLVIDEETAPMVRTIFELYASNEYSMKEIEDILYEQGYRNTKGNRLSHTTMANIIQNPKYKGYFVGGKVQIIDMKTKKQKFLPEAEWVIRKDETGEAVPAIVSEELWEKANEVFQRRSIDVKGRRNCSTHKNTYTGKLFCAADGAPYYAKDNHYKGTSVRRWVCSHKIKNGADSCPSTAVYEDELNQVVLELVRDFAANANQILDLYMAQYEALLSDQAFDRAERERLTQKKIALEEKQDHVVEMKIDGEINLEQFHRMKEKVDAELEAVCNALTELGQKEVLTGQLSEQMDRLKAALSHGLHTLDNGVIDRDFVDNYIRRIDVTPLENGSIGLDICILTNDIIHREVQKLEGRTGHTCKKMIEAYENGLK